MTYQAPSSSARYVLEEKKQQEDAQERLERRREERRKLGSPSMFSKRHYEAIAELMAKLYAEEDTSAVKMNVLIGHFSQLLAEDNERFDEIRFRRACKSV